MKPRIKRRRRGYDFFANFERALAPALSGEVDAVVHGGDLFFRSKIPAPLVAKSFEPLIRVADAGVPVLVVPGNHERSRIPFPMLASNALLHVFDEPRTFVINCRGVKVAFSGFPSIRSDIRSRFAQTVAATGWKDTDADVRVLCMHQTVEGATVGPVDYTFRYGREIILGRDIPGDFAAVLAGHIHRHQVLFSDLSGSPLAAPVFYPGSIERTAFAEKGEDKGYLVLRFAPGDGSKGVLEDSTFVKLPARPMIDINLDVSEGGYDALTEKLRTLLGDADPDCIVRIRVTGEMHADAFEVLKAAHIRALAPETMNVTVLMPRQ